MHIKTKCVSSYSISLGEPYPITAYEENPQPTRDTAHQTRRYIRGGSRLETRGEIIIQGLWEIQTDSIIEIRFGYSDADTYSKEPMENILA